MQGRGGGMAGGMRGASNALDVVPGDLLVGLHVWPTAPLNQVRETLERDDIAELSPLKFYVIRQKLRGDNRETYGEYGGMEGGYGGETGMGFGRGREADRVDKLVTGRIAVIAANSSKPKDAAKLELSPNTLAPGDVVQIHAVGVFPDDPLNGNFRVESMGTVALGPQYGRVKVAGKTILEAEEEIKQQLINIFDEINVQVTLVEKLPPKPDGEGGGSF